VQKANVESGKDWMKPGKLIGNGAYVLKERVVNEKLVVVPNTQSVRVHGTDAKLIRRGFTVDNGLRISDASQIGKPGEGGKR
ncbi:hypothetical protein MJM83_35010, partial [Salmonella enterica subsp. enterica serovar Montevideo]|nr:hypothetical protein [Salmonella enterica subsp. enterica serovar Montevideo]